MLSQSGIPDAKSAKDPVSKAAPIDVWIPTEIKAPTGTSFIVGNPDNTETRFLCKFNVLRSRLENYYVGYPITIGSITTKISAWDYTSTTTGPVDYFWVTVKDAISDPANIIPQTIGATEDITWDDPNDFTNGIIFLPDSVIAREAYTGFKLWNDNLHEGRTIVSYDPSTSLIGLDLVNEGDINNWSLTDILCLSNELPEFTGQIVQTSNTAVTLPNTFKCTNPVGNFLYFSSPNIGIEVDYATVGNITATYANLGTGGPGNTLTGTGPLTVDGVTVSTVNTKILVKNQTLAFQNGVYELTTANPFLLTLVTDFDTPTKIAPYFMKYILVKNGDTQSHTKWKLSEDLMTTFISPSTTPFTGTYTTGGVAQVNLNHTGTWGGPPWTGMRLSGPQDIIYEGVWSSTTNYSLPTDFETSRKYPVVSIQTSNTGYSTYFLLQDNTGKNPLTTTGYWSLFGNEPQYVSIGGPPASNPQPIIDPPSVDIISQVVRTGIVIGTTSLNFTSSTEGSEGTIVRITSFDPLTNTATFTPSLSVSPVLYSWVSLLPYSYDNAVPLTYTGSTVSQQQEVCYELELINLVLPNSGLITGGRVAFYPYVYVEFQSISGASAGTKNVIYSNNPHSKRMLFRCAIDDIPNPLITPFIKIDGDGMVQTVKFKPNDNFKFGVYLPNGKILETVKHDNTPPQMPDPLLQMSAMFSIKRLL
jgi:hypothetical protein